MNNPSCFDQYFCWFCNMRDTNRVQKEIEYQRVYIKQVERRMQEAKHDIGSRLS
jgi:ribosomal protein L44E